MASIEEIAKPLARAINIYSRVVRHPLDDEDSNRLTVHGLSYLRSREQRRRKSARRHKPRP
jgi:hypothetical protein